jgi:uncharacterized membrane protein
MFGRSRKEQAREQLELATTLAQDKKFRKQLGEAVGHGAAARRRAIPRSGAVAVAARVAADEELRNEMRNAAANLRNAWSRVEKKRSHKVRNTFLLLGATALAAVPDVRRFVTDRISALRGGTSSFTGVTPRTIDASIEVNVPVSTAYNQWTQFEDFPLFMEGVDHVQQIDDTRLHWAATVAGKKAEWDAKILEQHPDRQISWISEDGKKTRGTVSFESRGESKTLIRLSMSYQAEGPAEVLGSAAGLDARRVRGDLERFKELIENRGAESGAWRGEVEAGEKQ